MDKWSEVRRRYVKRFLKESINCSDVQEMDYIKLIIKEEFPQLRETTIDICIEQCRNIVINQPVPIDLFMLLMKKRLKFFIQ